MNLRHYFYFLLITLLTLCVGCKQADDNIVDIPSCLNSTYDSFTTLQSNCPGAQVIAYAFQEEEVIALKSGLCAIEEGTSIYNRECELVCLLDGFQNTMVCNGVEFYNEAEEVRIIWEAQ